MRLIVNTNRIIAALIKDSASRKIIIHSNAELLTIGFLNKEIQKYNGTLLKKSSLNKIELDILFKKLMEKVLILDDRLINTKIKEARRIMDKIDPNDTPFIAAALAAKADIWSDDEHFQRQNKVKVWRTKDLCFN